MPANPKLPKFLIQPHRKSRLSPSARGGGARKRACTQCE